jgi:hypothetical protein
MKQGNQHLCDKHYRFGQMRVSAKRNGKEVPSHASLHKMVHDQMLCPDCGTGMNWRLKGGKATVASLQHYRDGRIAIVCLSCNTRHASMDGDSYRDMPKDHKQCPSCKTIKPKTEFFADNSRTGVIRLKSSCKECSTTKVNQWRERNQDEYNALQRAYRAKRKAEGRPITRRN